MTDFKLVSGFLDFLPFSDTVIASMSGHKLSAFLLPLTCWLPFLLSLEFVSLELRVLLFELAFVDFSDVTNLFPFVTLEDGELACFVSDIGISSENAPISSSSKFVTYT